MNKKKALVTGAGGFIGSHLTEALVAREYDVRALVHYNALASTGWLDRIPLEVQKNIDIVYGDVRDPSSIVQAVRDRTHVFHLAALIAIPYSYDAPRSYIDTNVSGTLNVLEACRECDVERLVHTSTSEVFGSAQYTPIDEKHPLVAQSPYAASKVAADQLAESYSRSFGTPVVTVRPFNTFGPRQSPRAVIPTIITQLLSGGKKLSLGNTEAVRDLNFVDDTVNGFIMAAEHPSVIGKNLNFGRGSGVTIGELANKIASICDKEIEIVVDTNRLRPEASEVMELVCDSSLASTLTGWQPRISLEEGLEKTISWFKTQSIENYSLGYNK